MDKTVFLAFIEILLHTLKGDRISVSQMVQTNRIGEAENIQIRSVSSEINLRLILGKFLHTIFFKLLHKGLLYPCLYPVILFPATRKGV